MTANVILENFEKLHEKIVEHFNQNNDDSSLNEAKELFKTFINSNRQLQKVFNINDLLKILKRQGFYGAFDFSIPRIFNKIIFDESYKALVARHQSLLQSYNGNMEPLNNVYGIYLYNNDQNIVKLR
jgi:hypothetical protein